MLGLLLAPPVVPPLSAGARGASPSPRSSGSFAVDVAWLLRRAPMTADLAQLGRPRALARHLPRPALAHRAARALLPRHRRARAISPSTSAPTSATAPARCSRAGARVVALEPQRALPRLPRAATCPPAVTLLPLAAGPAPGRARARGVAAAPDGLLARRRASPTRMARARRASPRVRWDADGDRRGHHARRADRRARPAALRQDRRRGLRGRGARRPRAARCPGSPSSTCPRRPRPTAACVDAPRRPRPLRLQPRRRAKRRRFALDRLARRRRHRPGARRARPRDGRSGDVYARLAARDA